MSEIKVNDYIVARYNGASGDVIAGQVMKIRAGKAYMKNLLTGSDSERAVEIVNRRNISVPRKDALAVAELYHETEDKQRARKAAVAIATRIKNEEEKAATKEKEDTKTNGASDDKAEPKVKATKTAKAVKKVVKASKVVKQKAAKSNGAAVVHVQIVKDGKVVVDKSFKA